MKKEQLSTSMAKLVMSVSLIVGIGSIIGVMGYYFTKQPPINLPLIPPAVAPPPKTISVSAIELSVDGKSVLDSETKTDIFAITHAQQYLKNSGYEYNPDTFQTTNAKYAGDCFLSAVLSNNKDRIVFSSGCLSGDLPQAWIGVYYLSQPCSMNADGDWTCLHVVKIKFNFLIAGSGRNFVWSADDKTITYEADLGLSGMTETRTIDAWTGEVLERESGKTNATAKKIDSQNILSDKEVYEILREFAVKPNAANISDDNILLDAIKFQNGNLEERLKKIEYDLEERGKLLADAIDARGIVNARAKVCVARSVIYNNLKHTCDLKEDSFVSTEDVDDILATEEIIPYFLTGFAYFKDGDYAKANYYLNQVKLHRQAEIDRWKEDYFLGISGEVYEKIYNKTMKVLNETETADWKTYRNEEYGFEFKYPADWFIFSDRIEAQNRIIQAVSFLDKNIGEGTSFSGPVLDIRIPSESEEKGSLINMFGKSVRDTSWQSGVSMGLAISRQISVLKNPDMIIYLGTGISGESADSEKTILEQILSTFKFTE